MFLHQKAYAKRVVERFFLEGANPTYTPADSNLILSAAESESDIDVPFREAIGSLMFLAVVSRPDLAYIVNYLSRFMCNYDKSHWEAVKRVIRYVNTTVDYGIEFKRCEKGLSMYAFSDADFAGDRESRKSNSGCLVCSAFQVQLCGFREGSQLWLKVQLKLST